MPKIPGFLRRGRFNPLNRRNEKSSKSFPTPDYRGVMYAQVSKEKIVNLGGEQRKSRVKKVQRAHKRNGIIVGNAKLCFENNPPPKAKNSFLLKTSGLKNPKNHFI